MRITYSKQHPFIANHPKCEAQNIQCEIIEQSKYLFYTNKQLGKIKKRQQEQIRILKKELLSQNQLNKQNILNNSQNKSLHTKYCNHNTQNIRSKLNHKNPKNKFLNKQIELKCAQINQKTYKEIDNSTIQSNMLTKNVNQQVINCKHGGLIFDQSIILTDNDISFESSKCSSNQQHMQLSSGIFQSDISSFQSQLSSNNHEQSFNLDQVFKKIKISEYLKKQNQFSDACIYDSNK